MLRRLLIILEMIKFGHSVFALPFAVLASFIAADGWPGWGKIGLIVGCMVPARNVGMTYNRLADAAMDAVNPRTASRAIPEGLVTRGWAFGFTAINALLFVGVRGLFWFIYGNPWPAVFAIPVLAYLCLYSHTKRWTRFCHLWLGGAHAMAVAAGFVAINPGSLGIGGILLAWAVGGWRAGFDVIYATLDVDFDRKAGVHSLPARHGVGRALILSRTLHVASIIGFGISGYLLGLGWIFGSGVVLTAILLVVEHRLVREDDLSRVNVAFFTVNGIVSVVLGMSGLVDVLLRTTK